VLWVVWIWGDIETRHVAAEASISKATLTGVATTLESRGLVARRAHPEDGRRVLLSLTPEGQRLMETVFPQFNEQEAFVVQRLDDDEQQVLTGALRRMIEQVQGSVGDRPAGAGG
jgi:DNA-binding MarR family transcriptional regulator